MRTRSPQEYIIEFKVGGVHALPSHKAEELAAAFGRALDRKVIGVRVLHVRHGRDRVACNVIAPGWAAALEAARLANLAPDGIYDADTGARVAAPPRMSA